MQTLQTDGGMSDEGRQVIGQYLRLQNDQEAFELQFAHANVMIKYVLVTVKSLVTSPKTAIRPKMTTFSVSTVRSALTLTSTLTVSGLILAKTW